jgi:hypothetical protein
MRADIQTYFDERQVPGWFFAEDFLIFDHLLSAQSDSGDLLEIGAFQGASAILLGLHLRPGEVLTVCDLFESPEDEENRVESSPWYGGLTRGSFEQNYLAWLPELPTVVQGSSLSITEHVKPSSCRFVHIDGCHLYDFARSDLDAARALQTPDGVVACDDWRSQHTPGVTFAVVESVTQGLLFPIAITEAKLYGSWDEVTANERRTELIQWARADSRLAVDVQAVAGIQLPRVLRQPAAGPSLGRRARTRLARAIAGS